MANATVVAAVAVTGVALLLLRELRALRLALDSKGSEVPTPLTTRPSGSTAALVARQHQMLSSQQSGNHSSTFTAAGIGRMRAVGNVLAALPREEHNKLVAALSTRGWRHCRRATWC